MDTFEKYLNDHISNDAFELEANPAIFEQLKYAAMLKSSAVQVKQNSFIPSLSNIFSVKFLALKVSFAAVLLISFMGYQQINTHSNLIHVNDTAQVFQTLDTLNIKALNDSLCN
ncbi:MAG: hypothetical protein JEZ09_08515 [Salinivirgaceae bacterium]|nr:hypothetical protein [Salinivirgaceae bacterium]